MSPAFVRISDGSTRAAIKTQLKALHEHGEYALEQELKHANLDLAFFKQEDEIKYTVIWVKQVPIATLYILNVSGRPIILNESSKYQQPTLIRLSTHAFTILAPGCFPRGLFEAYLYQECKGMSTPWPELPHHMDIVKRLRLWQSRSCANCKIKNSNRVFVKRCSRCRKVRYCSRHCQKIDWKNTHRYHCKHC